MTCPKLHGTCFIRAFATGKKTEMSRKTRSHAEGHDSQEEGISLVTKLKQESLSNGKAKQAREGRRAADSEGEDSHEEQEQVELDGDDERPGSSSRTHKRARLSENGEASSVKREPKLRICAVTLPRDDDG